MPVSSVHPSLHVANATTTASPALVRPQGQSNAQRLVKVLGNDGRVILCYRHQAM